jgi:putative transcriptional regulator
MFNKSFLTDKIVNSLLNKDFEVLVTDGCFNIAAKNESLMLIKSLINIDGFSEEHALSLRSIAYFLSANPLVVSIKTNRQFLNDQTIYSRFKLPVITPQTFENFLEEEKMIFFESSKGKHTSEVDVKKIRRKRREKGFSLRELAQLVGISKKALYEIEKNKTKPSFETVNKIEDVLNTEIKVPKKIQSKIKAVYLKPVNETQKKVSKELTRIGIENSSVYSAPFELIGRKGFSLTTNITPDISTVTNAKKIKKLSTILSTKAFFVAQKAEEQNIEGVPVLLESELSEIETSKELNKRIKEKSN